MEWRPSAAHLLWGSGGCGCHKRADRPHEQGGGRHDHRAAAAAAGHSSPPPTERLVLGAASVEVAAAGARWCPPPASHALALLRTAAGLGRPMDGKGPKGGVGRLEVGPQPQGPKCVESTPNHRWPALLYVCCVVQAGARTGVTGDERGCGGVLPSSCLCLMRGATKGPTH